MDKIQNIKESVSIALKEDIGTGDVTASLFGNDRIVDAIVICREHAVLCGQQWFDETFHQLDKKIDVVWEINDGEQIEKDTTVCSINGPAKSILTGERTALNFLQTLSGTATTSKMYSDRVAGTSATILDTRKTIPGMRLAQKYAVTCGGGKNHRMGLYDAYLIKENHIATAGSIANAVKLAKNKNPKLKLEVEVENNDQLKEAIATEVDTILLDNFTLSELERAVEINENNKMLEASGNVGLENIREIAKTGVNYISIGAITKNIQGIDYSMRFENS